jgi:hypothetical protein
MLCVYDVGCSCDDPFGLFPVAPGVSNRGACSHCDTCGTGYFSAAHFRACPDQHVGANDPTSSGADNRADTGANGHERAYANAQTPTTQE